MASFCSYFATVELRTFLLTDSVEQSSWEVDSYAAGQEIPSLSGSWKSFDPYVDFISGLFPSGFLTTIFYAFLISSVCYMSHPAHLLWFNHPENSRNYEAWSC